MIKYSDIIECCDKDKEEYPTGLYIDNIEMAMEFQTILSDLFPSVFKPIGSVKFEESIRCLVLYQEEIDAVKKYLHDLEFKDKFNELIK